MVLSFGAHCSGLNVLDEISALGSCDGCGSVLVWVPCVDPQIPSHLWKTVLGKSNISFFLTVKSVLGKRQAGRQAGSHCKCYWSVKSQSLHDHHIKERKCLSEVLIQKSLNMFLPAGLSS